MAPRGSGDEASIGTRLADRDNALNAVRLLLAVFVIVDHSSRAATGSPGAWPYIGGFAVDGFFSISGYLIAGSRARMEMRPFLWRRALRLMPAYWAVLVVTAIIVAPLSASLSGVTYSWGSAASYVGRNLLLFPLQMGIGGTPAAVPYEGLWNTSTWTLPYEAGAYVVFGLLVAMPGFSSRATGTVCAVLSALSVGLALAVPNLAAAADLTRLWSFFAAGALLWFLRGRLPSSVFVVVGSLGVVCATLISNYALYLAMAPVPLAFLMLWLGSRLPLRIGARNDISYGMYLFAYPLQQLMIVGGVAAAVGTTWFTAISVAVTVPLAWASWLLVERPSMRLRRLVPVDGSVEPKAAIDPIAPAR